MTTLFLAALVAASSAKVAYVAGPSYFVDAGTADGIASGAVLDVVKKRGAKASCTVVEVAAHHAVCAADGKQRLGIGDRVTFTPAASPASDKVKPREAVPSSSSYAPLLEKVNAASLPRVAFKKAKHLQTAGWSARGSVTVRAQAWSSLADQTTYVRPSVDAGVHAGIGLLPGMYAEGALRVQDDVIAPATERFRPGQAQLYLWDASVGVSEGTIVGAVGRFRPRKAPGMELLDGAQAGFTAFGGALEVGAFAGAIPDLVTIVPSLDRLTTGAYFAVDVPLAKDVLLLPRARVGLVSSPDFKTLRAEAEVETQLLWGETSLGGSVRAGAGGGERGPASLDAARVDVDAHPVSDVVMHAGWRYLAPLAVDWDAAPGVPPVWGAQHGDLSATYSIAPWLSLGVDSGVGIDLTTRDTRGYAGPVVGLPTAFGGFGGLEIGYAEEALLGAKSLWDGRNAYVSTVTSIDVVHVVTRASYFEDAAPNDSLREAALMALVECPLTSWLSIRGRGELMTALPTVDGSARATPTALVGDLGFTGSL